MAAMNSTVLASNYAVASTGASELKAPSKMPVIRAQQVKIADEGRRAALISLATTLFVSSAGSSSARAGALDDALERSKANKDLNDKKRLATSGANFARANTVQFGTCKFPENFTGCQDLAKQKNVPYISDDIAIECEGKDKYKCGSNVFWKW